MRQICSKKTTRDCSNSEYYIGKKNKKKPHLQSQFLKQTCTFFRSFSVLTNMHEIKEQKKLCNKEFKYIQHYYI